MIKTIKLAVLASFLVAGAAWAHGEYFWIQERDKRMGEACCGEHDCHKVRVTVTAGQYLFAFNGVSYAITQKDAKPSEDGDYWACITDPSYLRCFFAPPMGA